MDTTFFNKYNVFMEEKIIELANAIKKAKKIVFFGGAGVSTESGIRDFRSKEGLYNLKSKYGVNYETILSHTYYEYNKEIFFKFYREFMINKEAKPNFAHIFLAKLENEYHKNIKIITQNIDNLHQEAGSKNVIELHGSIMRNYCEKCARFYSLEDILKMDNIPICPKCGGYIKPDVVLYEEGLDTNVITKALICLQEADLLIIGGTSLNVYPASSFISYFFGDNIFLINKEKLNINRKIKEEINLPIGETFKKVDEILSKE